jgi:hypothetical protein
MGILSKLKIKKFETGNTLRIQDQKVCKKYPARYAKFHGSSKKYPSIHLDLTKRTQYRLNYDVILLLLYALSLAPCALLYHRDQ